MQIQSKGKLFTSNHVWFETADEFIKSKKQKETADNLFIHANPVAVSKVGRYSCTMKKQETLISDLSIPEEELWTKMTKTVRNEINRSKRENVGVKIYRAKQITEMLLDSFGKMYHEMYAEKGIEGAELNKNELKAYASNDALLITVAEIGNVPVVYHSYIFDSEHSRFLQSCSEFRHVDNSMRNAIGRANKYLHWNDWMLLKEMGIKEYDWGGIASHQEPNGIDRFKMSFGGIYREYYNLYAACSLRARLFQWLQKKKQKC